jgi:hypothetical protein
MEAHQPNSGRYVRQGLGQRVAAAELDSPTISSACIVAEGATSPSNLRNSKSTRIRAPRGRSCLMVVSVGLKCAARAMSSKPTTATSFGTPVVLFQTVGSARAPQQHQLFGVFDYAGRTWTIEAGVGIGLTEATDHVVLKLLLSRDLN